MRRHLRADLARDRGHAHVGQPAAVAVPPAVVVGHPEHAALRADERIVNFLKGMNVLDERIPRLLEFAGLAGKAQTSIRTLSV